jgi:uncharacterized protein (DUF433 family)
MRLVSECGVERNVGITLEFWLPPVFDPDRLLSIWSIAVDFNRITHNPSLMGGKPCIRGLRIIVGTIVGLLASGESRKRVLQAYPYRELGDIDEALAYAAWRLDEREEELVTT